jgi:hypothetical protein
MILSSLTIKLVREVLRDVWSNVLVLLWAGENRTDFSNDSICEELRRAFDQHSECHLKILIGFNEKLWREDILTPKILIESLRDNGNDNGSKLCHVRKSNCKEQDVPAPKHS